MKILLIICCILTIFAFNKPASAQVGEWTKCIAWTSTNKYNIVNGGWSSDVCFALAQRCSKDPNVKANYYSNPVIVEAPYIRCTEQWNWRQKNLNEGITQQSFEPQNAFCRSSCQNKAAQCYRGCSNSSKFIQCTDKCDEEWAKCEEACQLNSTDK